MTINHFIKVTFAFFSPTISFSLLCVCVCVCVWWRQIAFLGKKNFGAKKNLMTAPPYSLEHFVCLRLSAWLPLGHCDDFSDLVLFVSLLSGSPMAA